MMIHKQSQLLCVKHWIDHLFPLILSHFHNSLFIKTNIVPYKKSAIQKHNTTNSFCKICWFWETFSRIFGPKIAFFCDIKHRGYLHSFFLNNLNSRLYILVALNISASSPPSSSESVTVTADSNPTVCSQVLTIITSIVTLKATDQAEILRAHMVLMWYYHS